MSKTTVPLQGRRVLITGAARGIGAETARRLHGRGARLALAGLEPDLLAQVAAECGDAPWFQCDVTERTQVEGAVEGAVERLGGLDVVMANAGVAAPLPIVGGDPAIFERTIAVNLLGVYYTLRAAGPHISHPRGYALAIASLAAALHAPMMGAYNASKAAVEALGNTLRTEVSGSGARVGVGYFGFIDTDMVRRGFETRAAQQVSRGRGGRATPVGTVPLKVAVDAIERGIERRSRRITAPRPVAALLPLRMLVQPLADLVTRRGLEEALATAREEHAPLTTEQPAGSPNA
ncbi:MAG TPA: SDR family NAD(P)-dependent oxidoreductase [Solirubrobacteraceae bacterium]|jgi:NAD(P)-dependent dehydrogenase (short-subunit alcohol dehydrogenase family)